MAYTKQEKTEQEFAKRLQRVGVPAVHSASHKELLRKAMLAEQAKMNETGQQDQSVRLRSKYTRRIIRIATLALLSAGIFMFFAINGIPQFSEDPLTHEQQVILSKDDLIAKALEADIVQQQLGQYRQYGVVFKFFKETGTFIFKSEFIEKYANTSYDIEFYNVALNRDIKTNTVSSAYRNHTDANIGIYDGFECLKCTEYDIEILNKERIDDRPDRYGNILPLNTIDLNSNCQIHIRRQPLVSCYGLTYLQLLPYTPDIVTALNDITSKEEYRTYMDSHGFVPLQSKAGVDNKSTVIEARIYSLFPDIATFQSNPNFSAHELYTAIADENKVTYIGKKNIEGREFEMLSYTDIDGEEEKFTMLIGFDPETYRLGYVHKSIIKTNGTTQPVYEYTVKFDDYYSEPPMVKYVREI